MLQQIADQTLAYLAFAWLPVAAYIALNLAYSLYVALVACDTEEFVSRTPSLFWAARDVLIHWLLACVVGLVAWDVKWSLTIMILGVLVDVDHAPLLLFPARFKYGRLAHSAGFLLFSAGGLWLVARLSGRPDGVGLALAAAAAFCVHIAWDDGLNLLVTPRSRTRLGAPRRLVAFAAAVGLAVLTGRVG